MLPRSWARNGWQQSHLLVGFLLCAAGIYVALPAWSDMLRIALRDQESSHMFLVPIVVAWLVWVRRGRLRSLRPRASWVGPALILAGWALFSLGDLMLVQSAWHGGAVGILIGCIVTVLGPDALWEFFPAFVVLGFLVPVPGRVRQSIAIPLEHVTAQVTANLLEVLGAPVQRMGNVLSINGVDVTIAEACNGLRMVFALVLVSFAFAFGRPLKNYVRVLILLASPVSAIVCNVIRLIPTVLIYGWYPASVAEKFHDVNGWIMLPVSFGLLAAIIWILRWALVPVERYTLAYD